MATIYSWGANSHGQLGLDFESELCMTPQRISRFPFNARNIKCIKGGGGHVIVLDIFGNLYTCGWNNRGQLGLNSLLNNISELTGIPGEYFENSPVKDIACGWDMSGAITADNKLFVWGANSFHQLGICQRGFAVSRQPLRLQLPKDEIPKQISFGLRHCSVLTEDDKIYIFGRLRISDPHPDLRVSSMTLNRTEVIKIRTEAKIDSITSGQNHLLILFAGKKRIIGVGDNKFGQSNTFDCDERIECIVSGWTHNGILTAENNVLLWGRNNMGQLGTKLIEKSPLPIKLDLPEDIVPRSIHLGSEHGFIISKCSNVYTWGWNEHGNCGTGTVENIYSPERIQLPLTCKLGGTGAGFCYAVCNM